MQHFVNYLTKMGRFDFYTPKLEIELFLNITFIEIKHSLLGIYVKYETNKH